MILGIGNDLTDIRRFEKILSHFDKRFINRCFSEEEIEIAESRTRTGGRAAAYAKRFAAKEACSKALGCGISEGVFLKDICVLKEKGGKPYIKLSGGALSKLKEKTPPGMSAHIHLSLSDEPPMAQAFVIIELCCE